MRLHLPSPYRILQHSPPYLPPSLATPVGGGGTSCGAPVLQSLGQAEDLLQPGVQLPPVLLLLLLTGPPAGPARQRRAPRSSTRGAARLPSPLPLHPFVPLRLLVPCSRVINGGPPCHAAAGAGGGSGTHPISLLLLVVVLLCPERHGPVLNRTKGLPSHRYPAPCVLIRPLAILATRTRTPKGRGRLLCYLLHMVWDPKLNAAQRLRGISRR